MPSILFVKTSSLGDVVHNCPAVSDVARRLPGAEIDWVVEEGFASLAAMHGAVRRVIPVAIRRWRAAAWRPAVWSEFNAFRRQLGAQRYDAVVDTQSLLKSALVARLADGERHRLDRASARAPATGRGAAAPVARGARGAVRQCADRDRRGYRPHASRRGARHADARHLLRLGSRAHRPVRRAGGAQPGRAGPAAIGGRGPREPAMRALYTLLLRLALPLLLARLWWRGRREPAYRSGITERLGIYALQAPDKLLWIHAVSVGEARAAEPLARALQL